MINFFAEEMMKQIDGICYNAEAEGWSAIVEETDTKKCAIDRNKLIVLINERCFRDKNKDKPFDKWTRFVEEGTNVAKKECSHVLCLCGYDIKYYYIYYRDTVRIIIGSQCINMFDGMTERIKEENDKLKTCVKCGKGKLYKGTLCAKCCADEIREEKRKIREEKRKIREDLRQEKLKEQERLKEQYLKEDKKRRVEQYTRRYPQEEKFSWEVWNEKRNAVEPNTPSPYIFKCSKLIDRYPQNTLYKRLLSQVESLSKKQEELIDSEFNFNFM
jgi:hypothetical protein